MKIERAIEILSEQADSSKVTFQEFSDARKLGIEALKEYQNARTGNQVYDGDQLPGETE